MKSSAFVLVLCLLTQAMAGDLVRVAVCPFHPDDLNHPDSVVDVSPETADAATTLMESQLTGSSEYQLLDRAEMQKLIKELVLSSSATKSKDSLSVGQWLVADILISGHIIAGTADGHPLLRLDAVDARDAGILASTHISVAEDRYYTSKTNAMVAAKKNVFGPITITADCMLPRSKLAFDIAELDMDEMGSAVRALVQEALATRKSKTARPPRVAPLFFSNRSTAPARLDRLEGDLMKALDDKANQCHQIEVMTFPYTGPSADEFFLRLQGLAQADPNGIARVSDLYVWGDYAETNVAGRPYVDIPVEVTLNTWNGSSAPYSEIVRGRMGDLSSLCSSVVDRVVTQAGRSRADVIRPTPEDRICIAQRLIDEANYRGKVLQDLQDGRVVLGDDPAGDVNRAQIEAQAQRLRRIAHFMDPENREMAKLCIRDLKDLTSFFSQYGVVGPEEARKYLDSLIDDGMCRPPDGLASMVVKVPEKALGRQCIDALVECLTGPQSDLFLSSFTSGYYRVAMDSIGDPTQRVAYVKAVYPIVGPVLSKRLWDQTAIPMIKAFVDVGVPNETPVSPWPYPGHLTRDELLALSTNEWKVLMYEYCKIGVNGFESSSRTFKYFKDEYKKANEARDQRVNPPFKPASNVDADNPMVYNGYGLPWLQCTLPTLSLSVTPILNAFVYSNQTCKAIIENKGILYVSTVSDFGAYGPEMFCRYDVGGKALIEASKVTNTISDMVVAGNSVWVATLGGGVVRYPEEKRYGESDGLPTYYVRGLAVAGTNLYVIGGDRRISLGYFELPEGGWRTLASSGPPVGNYLMRGGAIDYSFSNSYICGAVGPYIDYTLSVAPHLRISSLRGMQHWLVAGEPFDMWIYDADTGKWSDLAQSMGMISKGHGLLGEDYRDLGQNISGACSASTDMFWIAGWNDLTCYKPSNGFARNWPGQFHGLVNLGSPSFPGLRLTLSRGNYRPQDLFNVSFVNAHLNGIALNNDFVFVSEGPGEATPVDILDIHTMRWVGRISLPGPAESEKTALFATKDSLWVGVKRSQYDRQPSPLLYRVDLSELGLIRSRVDDTVSDADAEAAIRQMRPSDRALALFLLARYKALVDEYAAQDPMKIEPFTCLLLALACDEQGLNDPVREQQYRDAFRSRYPHAYEKFRKTWPERGEHATSTL